MYRDPYPHRRHNGYGSSHHPDTAQFTDTRVDKILPSLKEPVVVRTPARSVILTVLERS